MIKQLQTGNFQKKKSSGGVKCILELIDPGPGPWTRKCWTVNFFFQFPTPRSLMKVPLNSIYPIMQIIYRPVWIKGSIGLPKEKGNKETRNEVVQTLLGYVFL